MAVTIPPPVDRLVAAINGGDTEAFLALFAEDGVVDDWGSRMVGRAAIRTWSDRELIGAKGVLTVSKASARGGKATLDGDWKSNFYSGASHFVFTLDGETIREMRITGG